MEYAGYKGLSEGLDIAGLTGDIASKIDEIGKDRKRRKEELDQLATDTSREFSEMEMTKTESLNDKLLDLGNEGREKINLWNTELKAGRLSPSEYRKRMSSISEYTSLVGSTAKNFDAMMQEYVKRQADGTGSAAELGVMDKFGKLANIKDTQYQVLDDGRISIGLLDPETGEVISQEDLRVINKAENLMIPRMELGKEVDGIVKNWGKDGIINYLGNGGYKSSASAANDPKYGLAKGRVVDALVNQNAISLLVDNGGISSIDYAFSESDKEKKIAQAIAKDEKIKGSKLTKEEREEIEIGLILMGADGKPLLTDKQIEKAKEIAEAEIDLQVDNELKTVAPQNWNRQNYSDMDKERKQNDTSTYERLRELWKLSEEDARKSAQGLTALSGTHRFEWVGSAAVGEPDDKDYKPATPGGLQIYALETYKDKKGGVKTKAEPIAVVDKLEDIAPYMYGGSDIKGKDDAINRFNFERNLFNKKNKGSGSDDDPLNLEL